MLLLSTYWRERLATAFFSFLFSGCVCPGRVGANLSVYFVTQVADCIADMRLWKVHIGAQRPVRVLTSV